MYILISVTRESMDICVSFYPTRNEAYQAMLKDILISTRYTSVDEIRRDAESGKCGLTDEDAWAETDYAKLYWGVEYSFSKGTCAWKIVEVPEETSMVSHTALEKEDENAVDANGVSLAEKKAFLCETFGNGICGKAGADFYEFAYRAVKEHGLSLMDIDRWAFLNTIFGYDIGAENARLISEWYDNNGMDVLEIDGETDTVINIAELELGLELYSDDVLDIAPRDINYDWVKAPGPIRDVFVTTQGEELGTVTALVFKVECDASVADNPGGYNLENMLRLAAAKYAGTDLIYAGREKTVFTWVDLHNAAKKDRFKTICREVGLSVTVEEYTARYCKPHELLYVHGSTVIAKDIDWDKDSGEASVFLPTETVLTQVPDGKDVADVLSDKYGYCVNSYQIAGEKE